MQRILTLLSTIAFCAIVHCATGQCNSLYYPQSGRVRIDHDLSGLANFTKYMRFKIDSPAPSPSVSQYLFQSPNGFLAYDAPNNRMSFAVVHNRVGCNCCGNGCSVTEGYTFANGISTNEWHTVAIAVDSNHDVTIMLDGVIQSPNGPNFDGCCSGNYNHTVIGNIIGLNNPRGFFGWIDEAALWNSELSVADLLQLGQCGASVLGTAYGYWDFDEGSGAVAVDQSGNGFDGDISGLTYVADTGECCTSGCTDSAASNYDPVAVEDDGSCTYPGCTNQQADNFDANANEDDGSCIFSGCTNPDACNYDAGANADDGSCAMPGCTDPSACNFDLLAGCDSGNCVYQVDCAGICGGGFVSDACGNCYDPENANETVAVTFDFTGEVQQWIVPEGVTNVTLDLYGGQGSNEVFGGLGGRASGTLDVVSGQVLSLYVAGSGWQGGWNGGGNTLDGNGRRGGGASDVRTNGNALTDRVIVAGGGGCLGNATVGGCNGVETSLYGGAGGGEVGGTGESANNGATGGGGGTQNSGGTPGNGTLGSGEAGSPGQGGNGFSTDRGGGGGGYYGGAGGGSSSGCNRGAGGGGSNYLGGVNPILSESGVNEGSGRIIISYQVVSIPNCVPGCTDENAENYDAEATDDDGSCVYLGCTNEQADNYDPTANQDDGSCIFSGCTNQAADNYDPIANQDDGSCEFLGCTDPSADNYNATANVDDGSCEYLGCTDPAADNYNPTANVDDGSCIVGGCTYSVALNYNPSATMDDGSCLFDECPVVGCTDSNGTNYNPTATIDDGSCEVLACGYQGPFSVTFTKANNADWLDPANQDQITATTWLTRQNNQGLYNAFEQNGYPGNTVGGPSNTEWYLGTTADGGVFDSWYNAAQGNPNVYCNGDTQMALHVIDIDVYFDVTWHNWTGGNNGGGFSYTRTLNPGLSGCEQVPLVYGCMDASACNYDASASVDNGSCVFFGPGNCGEGTTWDPATEQCVPAQDDCREDVNEDGIVSTADLLQLLTMFGVHCQ